MKKFKFYTTEAANTMIHAAGSTVAFPHKGKMTTGKVVRYEKGGDKLAPHYVISHGEAESAKVPPHKVEKYGIFNETVIPKFERAVKTDTAYTGRINNKTYVVPHAFHGSHDVLHGTKVTPIRHSIVVSPTHVQHNNPSLSPEEVARVRSHIMNIHGGQDPKRLGNLDESWLPMRGPNASKETPEVNGEHAQWEKAHAPATRRELKAARPMRTGAADRFMRRYGQTNEERQLALHLGMKKSDSPAPKPAPWGWLKPAPVVKKPAAPVSTKSAEEKEAEHQKYRHAALEASRKAATIAFAKKHHIIESEDTTMLNEGRPIRGDVFSHHQTLIAKKTLRMPDAMLGVMGGPSKEESRQHLKKIGWTQKQIHDHEHAQFVQEHVWKVTDHLGHTHEVEARDHDEAKKKTVSVGGVHPQGIPMTQWGKVRVERKNLEEKTLTPAETTKKEELVHKMKPKLQGFKDRYGKDAKSVMYATATKQAKRLAEGAEPGSSTRLVKKHVPITDLENIRKELKGKGSFHYRWKGPRINTDNRHVRKSDATGFNVYVRPPKKRLEEDMSPEHLDESFMGIYTRNENANRHTANIVHLAKHFGDAADLAQAKFYAAELKKHGHNIHHEAQYKLHEKLFPKALAAHHMKEEAEQLDELKMPKIPFGQKVLGVNLRDTVKRVHDMGHHELKSLHHSYEKNAPQSVVQAQQHRSIKKALRGYGDPKGTHQDRVDKSKFVKKDLNEEVHAYDVHHQGKHIDTIFYGHDEPVEEVKKSLVNHDGYHPNITVRKQPRNPGQRLTSARWDAANKNSVKESEHTDTFNTIKRVLRENYMMQDRRFQGGYEIPHSTHTEYHAWGQVTHHSDAEAKADRDAKAKEWKQQGHKVTKHRSTNAIYDPDGPFTTSGTVYSARKHHAQ